MLFKPALNYFYSFFDRSFSEKTVFFLSTTNQRGRMEPPSPPWNLEGGQQKQRNGADLAKSNRKVFPSHWGLHDKKHGKVWPQLRPIFPASTVLRYRGQHCGSNPLQSRGNGPIIYLQILLLLFLPLLQKFIFTTTKVSNCKYLFISNFTTI